VSDIQPLFTIITPTLNASGTLEDAVCSAMGQGIECEHLIMDGCSSDRTLEIAQSFPHLIVHSGRDRGLYDAMNRGAFFARGEWLIFLQADDWLPEGALAALGDAIRTNPAAEILTGSAEAVRQIGENLWDTHWQRTSDTDKALTVENIALGEPMLNARAMRKSLFKKAGPFDLAYSLASDRDFLLKLSALRPQAATVDAPTYRYRWHEGSRTMNAGNSLSRRLTSENLAIARKHLSDSSWSVEDKLSLRDWHSRQSLQAALCAIEALQPLTVIQTALRATHINPAWLPSFATGFLRCFASWIGNGFKTRSQLSNTKRDNAFTPH
jgi:glycosyltransferase involved in cell wall biosynthesis